MEPSSVRCRVFPLFLKSFSPQRSSKLFIWAETAGWVMKRSLAAPVKLRRFAVW